MDLHELALERSLAFHRAVASYLLKDPLILEKARQRIKVWREQTPDRPFVREWEKILAQDAESVAAFLMDRGDLAVELRQSSPFAGVLDARERWSIWRETRERLESKR